MPTVRECDDCPWAYSCGYTEEWGCLLFGKECEKCKKYDSNVGGCYYSQKKLERLAYEYKKSCRHAQKIAEGYSPYFKKPKTEKTPVHVAGRGFMYKPLDFCGAYEWNYVPNRKGGHRHNHIRNAHKRMRKCHICGEPIVKGCEYTDGFSEFQCRSCRTEECREQACLVGLPFGGVTFQTRR